eukprot:TRINITY_DN3266_c0_g1_i1.p1 TRINITY_DN3266_c0_g1~~TRINITY_DN3266_c0_g1_i1.p1  ORF type:complete len:118 (-),score=20.59 TRINITY_DN3266_c0_g1_i1:285-638(-)
MQASGVKSYCDLYRTRAEQIEEKETADGSSQEVTITKGVKIDVERLKDESFWPNRYCCQWEDSNAAQGYIKGPSWAQFAPFVASPYHNGARIFKIPQERIESDDDKHPSLQLKPVKC